MSDEQPEKTELEKRLEQRAQKDADDAEGDQRTAPSEDAQETAPADERSDLEALAAERDELNDQLLRARAEFDNYRKRMSREAERTRRRAAENVVRDLLPVLDHLELALQHTDDTSGGLSEGVEMVLKQFCDALARHGLEPIPAKGEKFDPTIHEAVMQQASEDIDPHVVIDQYQKGYKLGDFVLRPAKVVVSSGPDKPAPDENEPDADNEQTPVQKNEELDALRESAEDAKLIDL
jgi:molecular chaperone GrpE